MGEERRGGVILFFFFSLTLTPVFCLWLFSFSSFYFFWFFSVRFGISGLRRFLGLFTRVCLNFSAQGCFDAALYSSEDVAALSNCN